MPLKTEKKTIDGVTYTTKTFPATKAIEIGARLARLVEVSSWAAFLEGEEEEVEVLLKNPAVILEALVGAAKSQSPAELAQLAKDVLEETEASNVAESGEPGPMSAHFDVHFGGRISHLFDVLVWVLRVGFGVP